MITQYKIVEAATKEYLESAVMKLMLDGWKVSGSVVVRMDPPEVPRVAQYFQAMVK